MESNDNKSGVIYVLDLGDGETFKIGFTRGTVEQRIRSIEKGTVVMPYNIKPVMTFDVYVDVFKLEQLIHQKFECHRINGEWFSLDFIDLVDVFAIGSNFGSPKLYARWFEVIPEDAAEYYKKAVLPIHTSLPSIKKDRYCFANVKLEIV